MNEICYLCSSKESKPVFNENGILIVRCKSCGHVYSTYEQEEHYDGYWGEGNEEYDLDWWDHAHRAIYSEFISTFMQKDTGTILDVGCGLGFFVKMVQEKKTGWNAIGFEMSEPAVKFAKEKNGLKTVYPGMVQSSGIGKGSVDIITLWDVIEHIPKPQPLLEYLYSLLKPGGILFLQTPNVPIQLIKANLKLAIKGMKPGVHYLEAKDHINDYSRKTLSMLGKQTGFASTEYYVLTPILSFAGSKSSLGKIGKMLFYYTTKFIWFASFKSIMLNNTLFAVMKK